MPTPAFARKTRPPLREVIMSKRQREKSAERRTKRAAMGPQATLRWLRIAPNKVRLVVDLVRGQQVEDALNILQFCRKRAAKPLSKLLRSAVANADQRQRYD